MNTLIIIFLIIAVYLLIGLLFAIPFAFKGVNKIDENAKDAGWGFRLIIIPGTMVFWPVFLKKIMSTAK